MGFEKCNKSYYKKIIQDFYNSHSRLPNYVFYHGNRVYKATYLKVLPQFKVLEQTKPKKEVYISKEGKYVYPTRLFNQNVGSGGFGDRWFPDKSKRHLGLDLERNKVGEPVFCITAGRVKKVSNNYRWDYFVGIEHYNEFCSGYWHLEDVPSKIKVGATVKVGELLGYIGRVDKHQYTGVPHLHFSIYNHKWSENAVKGAVNAKYFPGGFVDPKSFLKMKGATFFR